MPAMAWCGAIDDLTAGATPMMAWCGAIGALTAGVMPAMAWCEAIGALTAGAMPAMTQDRAIASGKALAPLLRQLSFRAGRGAFTGGIVRRTSGVVQGGRNEYLERQPDPHRRCKNCISLIAGNSRW